MAQQQLGKAASRNTDLITKADLLALAGRHAKFTGTITPPSLALLGTSTVTVSGLMPVATGDSLAVGELITLHINAGSALPSGLIVSYEPQVTAANTVTVKLVATIALSAGGAVPVTILAHR